MHSFLLAFGGSLLDAKSLLASFGVIGIFLVIFAETGLLIGFFLPGDSLLVLAGLVAAVGRDSALLQHTHIDLWLLLVGLPIMAIAGAQTGYLIGKKAGPALFNKPKSRLFKPEHVEKAQAYFDRYGHKTIVIARFVPIVRTFANPMAGVAQMRTRDFTIYNIIGGVLWTICITMLGFVLGETIPSAENHLLLIEAIIIVLSLTPVAIEITRARRRKRAAARQEVAEPAAGDGLEASDPISL
jgi:membrane-associated protein